MYAGIVELDLHRMTVRQAQFAINTALRNAKPGTYRLRLIHGYNHGTELKTMISRIYTKHPKVLRVVNGINPGETDLVLREF